MRWPESCDTERRSSDRRLPTAAQPFADADLKIGVPNAAIEVLIHFG
jgi:hypothetical protein